MAVWVNLAHVAVAGVSRAHTVGIMVTGALVQAVVHKHVALHAKTLAAIQCQAQTVAAHQIPANLAQAVAAVMAAVVVAAPTHGSGVHGALAHLAAHKHATHAVPIAVTIPFQAVIALVQALQPAKAAQAVIVSPHQTIPIAGVMAAGADAQAAVPKPVALLADAATVPP